MSEDPAPRHRSSDHGWLVRFWDFVDARQADKHLVAVVIIIYGTIDLTTWGKRYANVWLEAAQGGHLIPGIEVAAVIGAVLAPYMLVVGGVIKWYFESRKT